MAVAFLFVLTLSGGKQESTELVSGQAKRPTVHSSKGGDDDTSNASPTSSEGKDFDQEKADSFDPGLDEDKEFSEADRKFKRAVSEEVSVNQAMISAEIDKQLQTIEDGLEDLLDASGVEFTEDDIADLKEGFKSELEADVKKYIDHYTNQLLEDKRLEFENDLDRDVEDPADEGEVEAKEQEEDIALTLRDSVDGICVKAKDRIKKMSATAEQKILEPAFLEKTSQKYVAIIVEYRVTAIEKEVAAVPKTTKKTAAKKTTAPTPAPVAKVSKRAATVPPVPALGDDDDEAGDANVFDDDDTGDADVEAGDDDATGESDDEAESDDDADDSTSGE
jgi:hypothetical protein